MKKSLVLLSMLALSISAFGANVSLPKSYTVRYTHNFGRIYRSKMGQFWYLLWNEI